MYPKRGFGSDIWPRIELAAKRPASPPGPPLGTYGANPANSTRGRRTPLRRCAATFFVSEESGEAQVSSLVGQVELRRGEVFRPPPPPLHITPPPPPPGKKHFWGFAVGGGGGGEKGGGGSAPHPCASHP